MDRLGVGFVLKVGVRWELREKFFSLIFLDNVEVIFFWFF